MTKLTRWQAAQPAPFRRLRGLFRSMAKPTFLLALKSLAKYVKDVRAFRGAMTKAADEIAEIYRGYMLREFRKNSRGGGKWPKLKPGTIEAKGSSAILVDKGLMIGAIIAGFTSNGLGRELLSDRKGVRVFFQQTKRPDGDLTIADIASIHNAGLGNVPERRILIEPDAPTLKRMRRVLEQKMNEQTKRG